MPRRQKKGSEFSTALYCPLLLHLCISLLQNVSALARTSLFSHCSMRHVILRHTAITSEWQALLHEAQSFKVTYKQQATWNKRGIAEKKARMTLHPGILSHPPVLILRASSTKPLFSVPYPPALNPQSPLTHPHPPVLTNQPSSTSPRPPTRESVTEGVGYKRLPSWDMSSLIHVSLQWSYTVCTHSSPRPGVCWVDHVAQTKKKMDSTSQCFLLMTQGSP